MAAEHHQPATPKRSSEFLPLTPRGGGDPVARTRPSDVFPRTFSPLQCAVLTKGFVSMAKKKSDSPASSAASTPAKKASSPSHAKSASAKPASGAGAGAAPLIDTSAAANAAAAMIGGKVGPSSGNQPAGPKK